jgi:tetratricopeptide (TPR) repeat protein
LGAARVEYWGEADTTHLFFNVPPLPAHELVGRDEMLTDLRTQLVRGGAVAITALNGLPGVGKTTLAVMLTHDEQVRAHFSGGILWAGLGQNPAVDDILNQWADALGASLSGIAETADRARRVQAAIAARVAQHGPMLLVIDDVWSLEHAHALNLACENCAVLLTTRDEVIAKRFASQPPARVEELPEDKAVKLLMNVGQVDNLSYADLARLARAVGGLPLALMLVGGYLLDHVTFTAEARAAMTALGQTETWLGLVDTHRRLALQDVIGLSLDALPDDARTAFAGLAAFAPKPADFTEEAALAVTGAEVGMLGKLVKRNLLEKVTPKRATLHPTLAAVAERRAGERLPELRLAHARYYLDWVNQDRKAWQHIEPELEQIRAAWNHVQTLEVLRSTPERSEVGETSRVSVLDYVWAMHRFQELRGLWREKIDWIECGLKAARALGKRKDEATLLNNIGAVYDALGDHRRALEVYEQALPIRREVGDRAGEAATLNNIGMVYDSLGERRRALEVYEQALPIQREVGDRAGEATTLNNIGLVYHALGDNRRALEYFEQALPIHREVGYRAGEGVTLNNMGWICLAEGDLAQAQAHFEQALAIAEAVEYPELIQAARKGLEEARQKLGNASPDDEPTEDELPDDEPSG